MSNGPIKVISTNRKARFNYDIEERLEVGIVLKGSEVKVLRSGKAEIGEAFVQFNDSEAWLLGQSAFLTSGRHFRFADHAFLLNGMRYALHFCGTVATLASPRRWLPQGSAFLLNGSHFVFPKALKAWVAQTLQLFNSR